VTDDLNFSAKWHAKNGPGRNGKRTAQIALCVSMYGGCVSPAED
jgi:hypothetical protein